MISRLVLKPIEKFVIRVQFLTIRAPTKPYYWQKRVFSVIQFSGVFPTVTTIFRIQVNILSVLEKSFFKFRWYLGVGSFTKTLQRGQHLNFDRTISESLINLISPPPPTTTFISHHQHSKRDMSNQMRPTQQHKKLCVCYLHFFECYWYFELSYNFNEIG